MDTPQRSKRWLLRTRRFWFGLVGLLLLVAMWLGSGLYWLEIEQNRWDFPGDGRIHVDTYSMTSIEGYITFGRGKSIYWLNASNYPPEDWIYTAERAEFELYWFPPLIKRSDESTDMIVDDQRTWSVTQFTLPLWLLPLLWLIVWPWWVIRFNRREAAHLAKLERE